MSLPMDITMAQKFIEQKDSYSSFSYDSYGRIHIKGTENIKSLFNKVDNSFEKVLIVTCGGDHPIETLIHKSKVIHTFDVNSLTKYGLNLKLGAIRALNYEEFLKFLGAYHNPCFSLELYTKIRFFLDRDTCIFFDSLFMQFGPENVANFLFDRKRHIIPDTTFSIYSPEGYQQIKEQLSKAIFTFTQSNLLDIGKEKNKEQYDLIYLSNILYYLDITPSEYAKFLKKDIVPLLKENGRLFVHYLYGGFIDSRDAKLYEVGGKEMADHRLEEFCQTLCMTTGLNAEEYFIPCSGFGYTVEGKDDVAVALKRKK